MRTCVYVGVQTPLAERLQVRRRLQILQTQLPPNSVELLDAVRHAPTTAYPSFERS